jgi:hypothetical protein
MRQASERSNAVDCGSTTAIIAIRATKNSCSATKATPTRANQRNSGSIYLDVRRVSSVSSRVNLKRDTTRIWSALRRILIEGAKWPGETGDHLGPPVQRGIARGVDDFRCQHLAIEVDGDHHGQFAVELACPPAVGKLSVPLSSIERRRLS